VGICLPARVRGGTRTPAKEWARARPPGAQPAGRRAHNSLTVLPLFRGVAVYIGLLRIANELFSTRGAALAQPTASHATPETPPTALALLGTTIRAQRKRLGLNQAQLAKRIGLSRTYVSDIEHGRSNLTMLNLLRLAQVLKLPPSHLLQPLDAHPDLYPPLVEEDPSTPG